MLFVNTVFGIFHCCSAIQASLELYQSNNCTSNETTDDCNAIDPDLHMALLLSEQESKQEEDRRLQEEQLLKEILELSLTEK